MIFLGTCRDGKNCEYSHSKDELKKYSEIIKFQSSQQQIKLKTKMCNYLPFCQNGKDCNYAHSESELIENPFYKTRMCPDRNCIKSKCGYAHSHSELRSEIENPFHKTRMCPDRNCIKSNCGYAHSQSELRSESRENPFFKTVMCKNYPCDYGSKCWYAHSIEELQKARSKINEQIDSREDDAQSCISVSSVESDDSGKALYKTSLTWIF